jgi:hypothetical protein
MQTRERVLGLRWKKNRERTGAYVLKMPASVTAGIPDWVLAHPNSGTVLLEAKCAQDPSRSPFAFQISQLTAAQRLTARLLAGHGANVRLLILAEDGWCSIPWSEHAELTHTQFNRLAEPY